MRLTKAHLQFWHERKAQPAWTSQIKQANAPVSIHTLINSQDRTPSHRSLEMHNLLVLLRMARKRGELVSMLRTTTHSLNLHRARVCIKWLNKMEANHESQNR